MKRLVYVAGPYRAKCDEDKWQNIMRARDVSRKVWMQGDYAICPHMNSMFMDDVDTAEIFLEGDKQILGRCDAILMMDGWVKSEGAKEELKLAIQLALEVLFEEDLS